MSEGIQRSPLIAAGIVIGMGLGGFIDGIVLHQILQWHNMLSARIPPNTLVDAKINMAWDGYFHLAVWLLTAVGLLMLWRSGARRDVPWSGKTFLGSLLLGSGLFNVVEGVIDHELLGIHHVYEYTSTHLPWDIAFLAFGIVLMILGWTLIRAGRTASVQHEEAGKS